MRLISWNVNGIRACINKGFLEVLEQSKADVFCVQETKAQPDQLDASNWPVGYQAYWNSAHKKGYSGVLAFTRHEPLSVTRGIGVKRHDNEGRVLTLEFDEFNLVNAYTPNAQHELARLDYRVKQWEPAFRRYLKALSVDKPVIACGDFNVAHTELDIARPKQNERTAGFTIEERNEFTRLLKAGFIDSFREFEQGGGHYSWWSMRANARANNVGWRLDYFVISRDLRPRLTSAFIQSEVLGSDHCPVGIELY